jgi:vacuolar protein sorting-associated protein 35
VLTLLAIPNYVPLLTKQLFSTRRSIAHSIVSSVLKNETIIESPEDVDGVLELCHVLIKDQTDSGPRGSSGTGANGQAPIVHSTSGSVRRQPPHFVEREEIAEEQGWVARMVHLFRAESLDVQFEVCLLLLHSYSQSFMIPCKAVANCKKAFRPWRRTNAIHFPCTHYFFNKTL